ncbi:MAG: PepSY domain-containing protein [Chthoniobacterales bacterium]
MKSKSNILTGAAVISLKGLAPSSALARDNQAQLRAEAKVTRKDAEKTALARVPSGTTKDGELEKENGRVMWSFDLAMPHSGNIIEVQVDAKTGKIVELQVETPRDQAKETATDKQALK